MADKLYAAGAELVKKVKEGKVNIFGKSVIPEDSEMEFNCRFSTKEPPIKYANIKYDDDDGNPVEFDMPQVTLELTSEEGESHRALVPVNMDLLTLIEEGKIDTEKPYGIKGESKQNRKKTRWFDRYYFQIQPCLD